MPPPEVSIGRRRATVVEGGCVEGKKVEGERVDENWVEGGWVEGDWVEGDCVDEDWVEKDWVEGMSIDGRSTEGDCEVTSAARKKVMIAVDIIAVIMNTSLATLRIIAIHVLSDNPDCLWRHHETGGVTSVFVVREGGIQLRSCQSDIQVSKSNCIWGASERQSYWRG